MNAREQIVMARLSRGEKALLTALRTQDGLSEADEIAALMSQEGRRRLERGQAAPEIAEALRQIEGEALGAGGRPPVLERRTNG